jgi:glycerol-3-phosphate dehydrogenase
VVHLEDFLLRRSLLAMLGYVTLNEGLVQEVAEVLAGVLGWDENRVAMELVRTTELLRRQHGINVDRAASTQE